MPSMYRFCEAVLGKSGPSLAETFSSTAAFTWLSIFPTGCLCHTAKMMNAEATMGCTLAMLSYSCIEKLEMIVAALKSTVNLPQVPQP